jgi:hypothetical protein
MCGSVPGGIQTRNNALVNKGPARIRTLARSVNRREDRVAGDFEISTGRAQV